MIGQKKSMDCTRIVLYMYLNAENVDYNKLCTVTCIVATVALYFIDQFQ